MDALNYNKDTYYVGFDANQGAELQGQMVLDYIKENAATIDRNGDGVIGYVLAIGDIGHNDSIARTRGVRSALGTGVDANGAIDSTPAGTNVDGSAKVVQDATLDVDGKTYTIRELASQEMKNSAGATWDAATAGNAIGTWTASFGDQIDVVVSNNDGMGMSMFNAWAKDNKVPTFGYDANSDAVAAIAEGYGGTISQHADVQAYLTLRVLRNALDGVDIDTGIGTPDDAGNCLTEVEDYRYSEHRLRVSPRFCSKIFSHCNQYLRFVIISIIPHSTIFFFWFAGPHSAPAFLLQLSVSLQVFVHGHSLPSIPPEVPDRGLPQDIRQIAHRRVILLLIHDIRTEAVLLCGSFHGLLPGNRGRE